ncbi:MAG: hypothetical protein KDB67_00535 [Gordonia sp.]|nr:hypothetical protein [Gordonia sp. (in: high G+C Gram-positive bacteria)]
MVTGVAVIALVTLNALDVAPIVVMVVVGALICAGLLAGAAGRYRHRHAVLVTVDSDTVYFGSEHHHLVSRPLSELAAADFRPSATTTSTMSGDRARDLTVAGHPVLRLTFLRESDLVDGIPAGWTRRAEPEEEVWDVALDPSDPVAAEIISRIGATVPRAQPDSAARGGSRQHAAPSGNVPAPEADGPRIGDASSDAAAVRLWEDSLRRHDAVLTAYGRYELDTELVLRFPAVTDITRDEVQAFHDTLDDANALRTENYPGDRARAEAYQLAVRRLRRAWAACETAGKAAGTGYLDEPTRKDLGTALKLYRHAEASTVAAEQATYYGRVRDIVTTLSEQAYIHPPQTVIDELNAATRRALESGTSGA